jgi:hypothetical protein
MTTKNLYKPSKPLTEEQNEIIRILLKGARQARESYKYSEDEKMMPMACIYKPLGLTMMALCWKDHKEKYQMAAAANALARREKAICLGFATDSRWVNGAKFAEYYRFDPISKMGADKFQREYHRILAAHGGEVKNLPRELWQEAVAVFANGPDFPLTVVMAHYIEGPNDTVQWIEMPDEMPHDGYKSDLLTDWWS